LNFCSTKIYFLKFLKISLWTKVQNPQLHSMSTTPSCFYRSRTCQYCENFIKHEHQYCPLIHKTRKEIKAYLNTFLHPRSWFDLMHILFNLNYYHVFLSTSSPFSNISVFTVSFSSSLPLYSLFLFFYAHKLYMMRKTKIPVNPSYFEWIGWESKD
jgi:hypothetical protein